MKLNKTAKLAFYTARKRKGDTKLLSERTGLTTRYINYVLKGERGIGKELAKEMYKMTKRRKKNTSIN